MAARWLGCLLDYGEGRERQKHPGKLHRLAHVLCTDPVNSSLKMKHISSHPSTEELLAEWAGAEDNLITSQFYFWASGTTFQKSQEGLLQSLLLEMFKHNPSLIPVVVPDLYKRCGVREEARRVTWRRPDLLQCMSRLKKHTVGKRLCFFIDGLDEYEGDQLELVNLLLDVSQSPNIKLCVSSRPHNIFEESFGIDKNWNIVLQHFTKKDIRLYVTGQLEDRPQFKRLRETDAGSQLVESIVEKAQGVFLWVSINQFLLFCSR